MTPLLVSMVMLIAPFEMFYILLALFLFGAAIKTSFLPRPLLLPGIIRAVTSAG